MGNQHTKGNLGYGDGAPTIIAKVTAAEKEWVRERATRAGMSLSDFTRDALGLKPAPKRTRARRETP